MTVCRNGLYRVVFPSRHADRRRPPTPPLVVVQPSSSSFPISSDDGSSGARFLPGMFRGRCGIVRSLEDGSLVRSPTAPPVPPGVSIPITRRPDDVVVLGCLQASRSAVRSLIPLPGACQERGARACRARARARSARAPAHAKRAPLDSSRETAGTQNPERRVPEFEFSFAKQLQSQAPLRLPQYSPSPARHTARPVRPASLPLVCSGPASGVCTSR